MITITAKINLLSGDNKALSLGSDNLSGNNISSKLSGIVGVKKQGSNPFILGASKLGDGSTFSNGVDYFIGDRLSDENGSFLRSVIPLTEDLYYNIDNKKVGGAVEESVEEETENFLLFRYAGIGTDGLYHAYGGAILLEWQREMKVPADVYFTPTKIDLYYTNPETQEKSLISSLDGNNSWNSFLTFEGAGVREDGLSISFDVQVPKTGLPLWDRLISVNCEVVVSGEFHVKQQPFMIGEHSQYEIYVNSQSTLKNLSIAFDTRNNRHPNSILIEKYHLGELTINSYTGTTEGASYLSYIIDSNNIFSSFEILYVTDLDGEKIPEEDIVSKNVYRRENGFITFNVVTYTHKKGIIISYRLGFAEKTKIQDDDAIFSISDLGAGDTKLIIDNWNTPNCPLVISGIYADISIDIDRKNLISLDRSIFDRSDLKLPSYGIISNTGNIEFNDIDGQIRDYAEQLLLESGLKCEIKLNNTLVDGASETIGIFETDEWNYDNDNRVVSVSLKDELEKLQDIQIEPLSFIPMKSDKQSYEEIYNYLYEQTIKILPIYKFEELNENTQQHLKNSYMVIPTIERNNLWACWNNFCCATQSHMFMDGNKAKLEYRGKE